MGWQAFLLIGSVITYLGIGFALSASYRRKNASPPMSIVEATCFALVLPALKYLEALSIILSRSPRAISFIGFLAVVCGMLSMFKIGLWAPAILLLMFVVIPAYITE